MIDLQPGGKWEERIGRSQEGRRDLFAVIFLFFLLISVFYLYLICFSSFMIV